MRFGSVFKRAVRFAPFDLAWGKRPDWCSSLGLGCFESEQDVAAEAHGPALVDVHASNAKEVTSGAAGRGGLCSPVPLEDPSGPGTAHQHSQNHSGEGRLPPSRDDQRGGIPTR